MYSVNFKETLKKVFKYAEHNFVFLDNSSSIELENAQKAEGVHKYFTYVSINDTNFVWEFKPDILELKVTIV